jgi:hypothetical protein|tara:strand:- start:750 stop:1235 length:486 start_codon:yes stop_codon:yes gene_type:complete
MKNINYNILLLIISTSVLFLSSCGGGSSDVDPVYTFNPNNIVGEWQFNSNCTEYPNPLNGGADTIFLDNELPDSITVFSNSSDTLFIEAGSNNLNATVNSTGDFAIGFQQFRAYVDAFSDTITIFIEGTGSFTSANEGVMDLTFSEPLLQAEINCSINISK